jgi:hypothetical protein
VQEELGHRLIQVPGVALTRMGQIKIAILLALAKGILNEGVSGANGHHRKQIDGHGEHLPPRADHHRDRAALSGMSGSRHRFERFLK